MSTGMLSGRKLELLDRLLAQKGIHAPARDTAIPPAVSADGRYRLSFAQQRLWVLDRLQPGLAAYTIPSAFRLDGPLDADALQRALHALLRRHPVLGARFEEVRGEPLQHFDTSPLALVRETPAGTDAPARLAQALHIAGEEARRPFDLARERPLRLRLLALDTDSHVLVLVMHHIVSDAWSIGLVVRELAALYAAETGAPVPPLPALPVHYGDYAEWQHRATQQGELERQLQYWSRTLTDAPDALELPADRPRAAMQRFDGSTEPFRLDASTTAALRRLAQEQGATLFMTLLAAYQALLYRLGGGRDVLVGTPVAGRSRPGLEPLIGLFVNTLALRSRVDPAAGFDALLLQTRRVALEAFAHQDAPFEQVVERVQPERRTDRTPLFQTMFVLQNVPQERIDAAGMRLTQLNVHNGTSKFDLTLFMLESEDGVYGTFEYNRQLFDAATVARLRRHFETLVAAIVRAPSTPVARLPLFDADHLSLRLHHWQGAQLPAPDLPVHAAFRRQAAATPGAVAVRSAGATTTFAELDHAAGVLAARLRRAGAGPETRVGIFLDRSVEMVAAVWGILYAGSAYVPLDPGAPPRRVAFQVEDADLAMVVTTRALASHLPPDVQAVIVDEAGDAGLLPHGDAIASMDNLAYVLYTSGSTGQPKGVQISHRGLANYLINWCVPAYDVAGGNGAPLHSSLGFDLSVTSLLGPLLAGRSVSLVAGAAEIDDLAAQLQGDDDFSLVKLTPAHLDIVDRLLDAAGKPGSTRALVVGGEALPAGLVTSWKRRNPSTRIFNEYGPTETVVGCCVEEVELPLADGAAVPIGRPIPNLRMYVLDENGELAPVGAAGEIHIGGMGVARGYLRRPALTAERFLPDPFAGEPGARMYRSGDIGRHAASGRLAYLGRVDDQVKLRGFRIELGEIEACLRQLAGIADAVVCTATNAKGAQLAAYLVADGEAPAYAAVQEHLRAWLPDYMVPAAFAWIDAVPLTGNGKVDRAALARSGVAEAPRAAPSAAPRSPAEQVLAGIFADVLDVAQVGADDDFFALGGHSMLALQVAFRVREAFGVEVPLRALFDARTVAGLAQHIDAAERRAALPPLVAADRDGRLPLSFAQQRLWFLHRLAPHDPVFNIPYTLQLRGRLDIEAMRRALGALVDRHEVLRTSYPSVGGEPRQHIHASAETPLHVADLRGEAEPAAVARASLRAFVREPIDIATAPSPLRVSLLRTADDEYLAALVIHHIASDAWSTDLLVRELVALYDAFERGQPSPFAPLAFQYADFAAWQRQHLDEERIGQHVAWWREHLGERPPILQLPTDRPRRARTAVEGAVHAAVFPATVRDGLQRIARTHAVTPFMATLAAFQMLLQRYSGQRDFVVGTPVAERGHAGLDGTMGLFLNLLPLRADLGGEPTVRDVLERVRAATLDAFAHAQAPFERLVDAFRLERDLANTPLFQVMFTYQHVAPQAFAPGELDIRALDIPAGTARYELTLFVIDTGHDLAVRVEYDAGLFDEETIARMTGHLHNVLAAMIDDTAQRADDIVLLSGAERERLVRDWNATRTAYPLERSLHALIAAQARERPDATAAVFPDSRLTYAELDGRANRLARFLRTRGVGPESLVALCVGRAPEMLVGILGILKAGGAYLPLDPEYPVDRLAYMLADSSARLVLTQEELLPRLPAEAQAVCLDRDWADLVAQASDTALAESVDPDGLAYLIYTSGSTGRPKGTMVSHRSAVNHAYAMIDLYGLDRETRFSQHFSLSFDGSVEDFFPTLLAGGAILCPPNPARHTMGEVLGFYAAHGITALHLPTALWHYLATELHEGKFTLPPSLRITSAGGEALATDKLRDYLADSGGRVPFLNVYGPTEATVTASTLRAEPGNGDGYAARNLPIGRPLPNVTLYVLDARFNPTPAGVPGEAYIGGTGVARGYLGRPGLTAERFVPDPFGEPGARLYRTGDLVRHLPDGVLDYLGRIDQQVKIRSFRIELAEIEATIATHPAVAEVVVDVRAGKGGSGKDGDDKRIVAYYVATAGAAPPEPGELRRHLEGFLPPFMLPSALVALPRLPLTPNGKIDRARLPEPDYAAQPGRLHVAPRTPAEARVANHWNAVLGIDAVGVEDNFFELGGHSLLIARLHERLQQDFGRELPLIALFEHSTVARQADYLSPRAQPDAPADAAVDSDEWARERRRALARQRGARKPLDADGQPPAEMELP